MVIIPRDNKDVEGVTTPDTLSTHWDVEKAQWVVSLKTNKLLEGSNSKEKIDMPVISEKMQKYLDVHGILEQNLPECISLIKQIGELIFSKKLESRGKKLKSEIEELLKNDDELANLVMELVLIDHYSLTSHHQEQIVHMDLIPIIVDLVEYERRLVGQYRRNKDELLEKLKNLSNINIWWDKFPNNIASLTVEELIEFSSSAENATWLDISSFDLDLLSEGQLRAIFSNFKNIKIADLSRSIFNLWKTKWEIIFSNLEKCETLNFWMNMVTDEILELMVKYLKNIKSIDFTMCDLTQKQKDFIKDKFPNADICIDDEADVNY